MSANVRFALRETTRKPDTYEPQLESIQVNQHFQNCQLLPKYFSAETVVMCYVLYLQQQPCSPPVSDCSCRFLARRFLPFGANEERKWPVVVELILRALCENEETKRGAQETAKGLQFLNWLFCAEVVTFALWCENSSWGKKRTVKPFLSNSRLFVSQWEPRLSFSFLFQPGKNPLIFGKMQIFRLGRSLTETRICAFQGSFEMSVLSADQV